ncbi:hypothetical protein ILUMI_13159 [Ignelater luminosus]|uniref:Uncharacterized protein n=1 Tax=Ignelater luminosus TaxID=2038154 RepID=A0A8K0CSX6_IGNLU|nr:hypothetical protein ILUMI_13159 [Ignelater luminosus]
MAKVGIKGKAIHSQARETIVNLLKFMRREAENQGPLIPLPNFKKRLVGATNISEFPYRTIQKETEKIRSGESTSFSSPKKKRLRASHKTDFNDGQLETIRAVRLRVRSEAVDAVSVYG